MKENNHAGYHSLFADMSRVVQSGKRSYYTFLAVTIVTLLMLAAAGIKALCGWWNCIDLLWLLGVMVFFIVGSIIVHRRADVVDCSLCKRYTEFWHERRRQLRKLMFVPPGGAL